MKLGIDFGTTRTVVAAATRGRYPIASFETESGFVDYLPGLVARRGAELVFGWSARELLDAGREPVFRSIKRAVTGLCPDDRVSELGDAAPTALDLVTGYLTYLRKMLLENSNLELSADEPLEAMVAVPANASTQQRYLTLEAFSRAGFRVLGMISEPTAAAIEFAQQNGGLLARRSPKRYLVVYDLGGGTFDASAIAFAGRRFELVSSEGLARLGGDDFDEVILNLALENLGMRPTAFGVSKRAELLEQCRTAKESITTNSRRMLVDLTAQLPDSQPVTLDLNVVAEHCAPYIQRTTELLERLFAALPAQRMDPENPRELGAIYLVGGSTAFPPVIRALRAMFKRKIQLAPQPHAATAVGLAVAADPEAQVFVREAVTRHFGVWREHDQGKSKMLDAIFDKNTPATTGGPLIVERRYRPVHTIGHLRFIECSDLTGEGQPSGDVTPCGELFFPYDPGLSEHPNLGLLTPLKNPDLARHEIKETYFYKNDGTVEVCIENMGQGYARNMVLSPIKDNRPLHAQ